MPQLGLSLIISFFLLIFRVYKEKEEKREHEETRYSCCMLGKATLLFALGGVGFQASSSGG